jgi:hypothetical protein
VLEVLPILKYSSFDMNPSPIDLREVISSQIPALALLQNIGYTYITPAEALAYRQRVSEKGVAKLPGL